jgi:hypothetical protein
MYVELLIQITNKIFMKKIILTLALVLGCLTFASAQNALGLKFGNGVDLSYQHGLGGINRLELNLGLSSLNDGNLAVSGLYQWVWNLAGDFNWYAGAGAGAVFASDFGLNVLGNIGIEYNFSFPLQLAIDYTPSIVSIMPDFDFFSGHGFRFAVRWRF